MLPLLKKIFRALLQKTEVNYLYFGLFFLFLVSLSSLLSFFLNAPPFFFLYAVGQACFEVVGCILIAHLLKQWAPRWAFSLFIALFSFLALAHFTHFTLVRLMDASISYLFKFFFSCGLDHFLAAIQALNLNGTMAVVILLSFILIPIAGFLLYHLTRRISNRHPWSLSLPQVSLALVLIGSLLLSLDLFARPFLSRHAHYKFQKALPLGATFLSPQLQCIELPAPLAFPREEEEMIQKARSLPKALATKPNIYLFVIETLRRDFVTPEIAPHLTAFAEKNIAFPLFFANATSTHLSWFAIFHSNFPHHWTATRDYWKGGSLPLRLLKRWGYKIRVFSSANLRYYTMDRILFGEGRQLVDQIEEYSSRLMEPWERDALALQDLAPILSSPEGKEGNVFLFFLDSTHSEYSFPPHPSLHFQPILEKIDYLTVVPEEIEPIKNRYKNAIAYVDSLLGTFFSLLKKENLYDEAIIAITGDHGEEFFEEGALFHGTHLNTAQTSVPLLCKFQNNPWPIKTKKATHIDLFPSILHFLTHQAPPLFDGQSLFLENRYPLRLAVLQNGSDTPIEFSFEKEGKQLHARFPEPRAVYTEKKLELLSPSDVDLNFFFENTPLLPLFRLSKE